MRIFSKKAFQFDHPAGQEPAVVVRSQSFATVPDWVRHSAMFELASASGDVSVIETKQDEKAAETATNKRNAKNTKDTEDASKSGETESAEGSKEGSNE